MSSLAFLTIGKEYYETNISWLIPRVDNISFRVISFWNFLIRFVSLLQYQKYWKLAFRTFACQKYLGIYWKKWFISLFRQCPRTRGKLTICVWFFSSSWVLIIQGIISKDISSYSTFGLIVQVLGGVSPPLGLTLFFFPKKINCLSVLNQ